MPTDRGFMTDADKNALDIWQNSPEGNLEQRLHELCVLIDDIAKAQRNTRQGAQFLRTQFNVLSLYCRALGEIKDKARPIVSIMAAGR